MNNVNQDTAVFAGLEVVELASVLAGPAVGMFFAELGARVVKVENKRSGGDVTRSWKLASEDNSCSESAYYNSINWGKQAILLDLTLPPERAELEGLLEKADVLITNFKKGDAAKFQLDRKTLAGRHPGLIAANITAFGENEEGIGYDVLMQAETGYLHMTGHPDSKPAKLPVALIDLLAAHQLKEAILIALMERMKTGRGAYVSVSLARAAIGALANQASNYLNCGVIPGRMGSCHPNISPYGDVFTTADDREIILAVGSDPQFKALCDVLDISRIAADERFRTNASRVANRVELAEALEAAINTFEFGQLLDALTERGIPAGRIRDMQAVFETEAGRSMVLENTNGSRCVRTVAFEIHPFA